MSGYLGRLFQAAVRSERRLRPFAGSIYGDHDAAVERSPTSGPDGAAGTGAEPEPSEDERRFESRQPAAGIAPAPNSAAFMESYQPLQRAHRDGAAQPTVSVAASGPARRPDNVRAIEDRAGPMNRAQSAHENRETDLGAARRAAGGARTMRCSGPPPSLQTA